METMEYEQLEIQPKSLESDAKEDFGWIHNPWKPWNMSSSKYSQKALRVMQRRTLAEFITHGNHGIWAASNAAKKPYLSNAKEDFGWIHNPWKPWNMSSFKYSQKALRVMQRRTLAEFITHGNHGIWAALNTAKKPWEWCKGGLWLNS